VGRGREAAADRWQFTITQGGPRRLWDHIERLSAAWSDLGRPTRARFGLTATTDGDHRFWLDHPTSPHTWPIPRL
jgi:hypothetical protein